MNKKDIAKILITGPFNSGKTTLIHFISDEQLTSNDVETTDELAQYKSMTTVGLEFGVLHVDDELDVHLFGTPGQARFNFMWKTLSKGALGTVFLVDSSNQKAIDEAKEMFQFYCDLSDMPIIICATKQDLPESKSMQHIASELGVDIARITSCNPSVKEDSKKVIIALLEEIIAKETLLEESIF
ncbi:MAG: hypothetical protein COB41_02605 [Proteobacteria bacterium]|nr:MAG: hypothetical protein COB41_02605 [Pseudomonadota bacterium]